MFKLTFGILGLQAGKHQRRYADDSPAANLASATSALHFSRLCFGIPHSISLKNTVLLISVNRQI